jgi:two-component system OmpR family sensor kinase
MRRWLRTQPITVRVTAGFLCAMALLFALTGAFIYERMQFALNRSIRDVPSTNHAEIGARERHRDEALNELLVQLAVAFSGTLLISGLVGHRVARAALGPVERMRRRASAESADASFRLPVPDTHDELSRLAETLNDLLARMQTGVDRERRLIADASHELRTPLSHLLLRVDLALSRERDHDELHAVLLDLQQDVRRLVRLANDLLLIARADDGQLPLRLERIRVHEVVAESADRFEDAVRRDGRSIVLAVDRSLVVQADRDRVAQALDNLVDNAIHHGRGTITISASAERAAIAIAVRDEGPGFGAGFAEHAFDRFTTADPGRSSTRSGLGLAIVAAIATAHGGRATALDGPGGAVQILLPTADPYGDPRESAASEQPAPA